MELVKKGMKFLKARGSRAFIKAVFIRFMRSRYARRGDFENVDAAQWLRENFSNCGTDVVRVFADDTDRHVRNFVSMYSGFKNASKPVLAFNHSLGGGATAYLDRLIEAEITDGNAVMVVRAEPELGKYLTKYLIEFHGADMHFTYKLEEMDDLREILHYYPVKEIYVNSLVRFPDIYYNIEGIIALKNNLGASLSVFFHDYYPVCPTVNLLDRSGKYCGIPQTELCNQCFLAHTAKDLDVRAGICDIQTWRGNWMRLFESCDEIRVFSNSTKQILVEAFGVDENAQQLPISVIPHRVDYVPKIMKTQKTTTTLNIGLLGVLAGIKGADIVQDMISQIEKHKLNINIVLIGYSIGLARDAKKSRHYKETGEYKQSEIAQLAIRHDIDIFFIPSVCPETFSFTCEEAIQMGMPVACFDIGAPAERVAGYERGLVIGEVSADEALKRLQDFAKTVLPYDLH